MPWLAAMEDRRAGWSSFGSTFERGSWRVECFACKDLWDCASSSPNTFWYATDRMRRICCLGNLFGPTRRRMLTLVLGSIGVNRLNYLSNATNTGQSGRRCSECSSRNRRRSRCGYTRPAYRGCFCSTKASLGLQCGGRVAPRPHHLGSGSRRCPERSELPLRRGGTGRAGRTTARVPVPYLGADRPRAVFPA